MAKVLNDTTVRHEHSTTDNPGSTSKKKTKNDRNNPDLR
jgi:hypothetical protein